MVTVQQFLEASRRHWGHPYSINGRFGPKNYDCSGHVWASLRDAGATWDRYVSSEQYKGCFPVSLAFAVRTPGSLIFMPADPRKGIESGGHVAIVYNAFGFTSEARGHAWGVGSWQIAGRGFSPLAGLCPLVDYNSGPAADVPVVTADVIAATAYLVSLEVGVGPVMGAAGTHTTLNNTGYQGPEVAAWQSALNLVMHAGLPVDGDFGPKTAQATGHFQVTYNYLAGQVVVPTFGVVEAKTRGAMMQSLANLIGKTQGH